MAGAVLNVENAPRDVAQLMQFGRYSLRNLAYETNLLNPNEPDKVTAFDRKPMEERAKDVLDALLQIDKKAGGGEKKTSSPKKREPAKKREPVKATESKDKPKPEPVKAAASTTVDLEPLLAKLTEIVSRLEELEDKVDDVRDVLGETKMATLVNIGVNCIVGEQILQGATVDDIIKDGTQIGMEAPIPEEPEDEEGN